MTPSDSPMSALVGLNMIVLDVESGSFTIYGVMWKSWFFPDYEPPPLDWLMQELK